MVTPASNSWHFPIHFSADHKAELSVLTALCLLAIFVLAHRQCSLVSRAAMALGLLGVYCYRAATGHLLLPWQQDSQSISKYVVVQT